MYDWALYNFAMYVCRLFVIIYGHPMAEDIIVTSRMNRTTAKLWPLPIAVVGYSRTHPLNTSRIAERMIDTGTRRTGTGHDPAQWQR